MITFLTQWHSFHYFFQKFPCSAILLLNYFIWRKNANILFEEKKTSFETKERTNSSVPVNSLYKQVIK